MTMLDKQLNWFRSVTHGDITIEKFVEFMITSGDFKVPNELTGIVLLDKCLDLSGEATSNYYTLEFTKYNDPKTELEEKLSNLEDKELSDALTRLEHLDLRIMELNIIYNEYSLYLTRFKAMIDAYNEREENKYAN